ncbi:hypothetical protein J7K91_01160 [bacterium]|nr:hypothetical protein [bacterium]
MMRIFILFLSGLFLIKCANPLILAGASAGMTAAEVERAPTESKYKKVVQKIILEEKGILIKTGRNYWKNVELIRNTIGGIEMPIILAGKEYKAFVNLYMPGVWHDKIVVAVIPKRKREIRVWVGKVFGRFIISEDLYLEKDLVEEIKHKMKK